jgi:hypothetical protein
MSQVKYQITLSIDGNHSVSVTGDDPTSVKDGLAWARGIYLKLKERSGSSGSTGANAAGQASPSEPPSPAPICAIHHQPMVSVTGKKGQFWSCHQKLEDGSWCPYKPPKP